jgi:hypothetical protein
MPSTGRFTQGGKLGKYWHQVRHKSNGSADANDRLPNASGGASGPPGKPPLTVFSGNPALSPKICPESRWFGVLHDVY